ncbi:MAG TPA: 3-dehydroquinate synthase [Chitinophagaceae bacterium]|nr:3-dehydroquinate synthase [Chitinophagaceae bacterium]
MKQKKFKFSSKLVKCYFDADFSYLEKLVERTKVIIITDENLALHYANKFMDYKTIVVKAGEEYKQQSTVDHVIIELIKRNADRESILIGVGGGVITDITGYTASVYMRGVKFAFVPTTILAMVDAAVGGKNGVDVGVYKNLVGVINHPEFLLYDYSFLKTLPQEEWINGFAEIIKHACIKDKQMFSFLEKETLEEFQNYPKEIAKLIKQNVEIKYSIVSKDENETGDRKLLNFGHTLGHAVENIYKLSHGNAVSIGIAVACKISGDIKSFSSKEKDRVLALLKKYHLPVDLSFDKEKVWEVLLMDKKKSGDTMNFILLNKIGDAIVKPIPLDQLKNLFNQVLL